MRGGNRRNRAASTRPRVRAPPVKVGRACRDAVAAVQAGPQKRVVWNQPVDVKGGDKALTLDARNAMPVD